MHAFCKIEVPATKPVLTWGGEGNHTVNEVLYVIRDDDVTILCHSNGDPSPKYKWLGQSTENKRIHIASIQTSANKTCTASNVMHETFGGKQTTVVSTTVSIIVSCKLQDC